MMSDYLLEPRHPQPEHDWLLGSEPRPSPATAQTSSCKLTILLHTFRVLSNVKTSPTRKERLPSDLHLSLTTMSSSSHRLFRFPKPAWLNSANSRTAGVYLSGALVRLPLRLDTPLTSQ